MLKFFEDHKGWVTLVITVMADIGATQLGLDHDTLVALLTSITGLAGTYIATHNVKKGMVGSAQARADIASTAQPE